MSSSNEELAPLPTLPLEVEIPKEHLPDILDVYDKHAFVLLRITIPRVYSVFHNDAILMIPAGDPARTAEYRSWAKFLARCPVKFVRKYPVRVPIKDEGMSIPAPPSIRSSVPHTQRWLATAAAQSVNLILTRNDVLAPATTHTFSSLRSHSRRHLCAAKLQLNWRRHIGGTASCSITRR
jgi:hypothetical protein